MTSHANENASTLASPNEIREIRDEGSGGLTMNALRALSGLFSRSKLGRLVSFGDKRDYNTIFGWDTAITPEKMQYMYNRGGIAKRLVDAYPDAIWARPPEVWAEGDDEWSRQWDSFVNSGDHEVDIWSALHRLDKLVGLGHYAILLMGTDKPGLENQLRNPKRLTFLQPYSQVSAKIHKWDKNPTSPNFGRPLAYRVYPDAIDGLSSIGSSSLEGVNGVRSSFLVHSSRVLHAVRGNLEDDVYGQPLMAPSWDYLTDLRKVVGSSSESYWIMANRGIQANVDKDMALAPEDEAALQQEMDEYFHGYRRFMRTKGVTINELSNDVANPKDPFDVLVTLISGTSGIPKRILLGSEAGQLASTQDKGNWAERLEEDRALHQEPHILKPFIQRMIAYGFINAPRPGAKIRINWPDAYRMSPLERGQTAAQTARTIANVTKMLESRSPRASNLFTDDEIRALLGFPSDNRILKDDPKP